MLFLFNVVLGFLLFYTIDTAPQHPEINDQFETVPKLTNNETKKEEDNIIVPKEANVTRKNAIQISFTTKLYHVITAPIAKFVSAPKVNSVLRNIGTCIVNGAMEIISYYFPAPFIPLIASAAGMVIPFEPVVMLKEKMPVTSYRRAFRTAMNSFLGTFDKYKVDEDPYMTRRFNRRLNYDSGEKDKKV